MLRSNDPFEGGKAESERPAFRIVPVFKEFMPPLSAKSRSVLKSLIADEKGCHSAFIAALFADKPSDQIPTLIDGHHRNELIDELRSEGVDDIAEPMVLVKKFANEIEAANYVAKLQNGRRNWEPQDRIRFILEKTDHVRRLESQAAERKKSGKRGVGAHESQGRVAVMIAREADTSPTTVKQVRKILESNDADIIGKVWHSDPKHRMSIAKASGLIRSSETDKALQARSERLKAIELPPIPDGSLLDQVICADVLEGLRRIPDGSVEIVVTSPPYAVWDIPYDRHRYDGDYQKYLAWLKVLWAELYRVMKRGGRLIINIDASNDRKDKTQGDGGAVGGLVHNVAADFDRDLQAAGWLFRGEHCWYKQNTVGHRPNWGSYGLCSSPRIRRNHEYVLVYCKETPELEGDRKLCDLTAKEFEVFTVSQWYIKPESRKAASDSDFHPVPFPEELVYRLLRLYSYVGSTVLDPFNGSGTTTFVAKALNRRFVGIDNSPLYCDTAKRRLESLDGLTPQQKYDAIDRFATGIGERTDGYGMVGDETKRARSVDDRDSSAAA